MAIYILEVLNLSVLWHCLENGFSSNFHQFPYSSSKVGMYDKLVMQYAFNQNILKKQQDDYDGGSELFTPTLTTNGLCYSFNSENYSSVWKESLLHFVAFFHVASLFSTRVDD